MAAIVHMSDRFSVGTIIFAKASIVMKAGKIGRFFGARSDKMWLPGKVMRCNIKKSDKGRNIKYITCIFYIRGFVEKIYEIGIQATKIWPPPGTYVPESINGLNLNVILAMSVATAETEASTTGTTTLLSGESLSTRILFPDSNVNRAEREKNKTNRDDHDNDSITIDSRPLRTTLPTAPVSFSPGTNLPTSVSVATPVCCRWKQLSTTTQLTNKANNIRPPLMRITPALYNNATTLTDNNTVNQAAVDTPTITMPLIPTTDKPL